MLEPIPVLVVSWLSNSPLPTLIPTHIKHLRSTAPKDMKTAKETRNRERAEVKKAKKSKKLIFNSRQLVSS
jgi:ribonuclease P/MRP protein subunit POP3